MAVMLALTYTLLALAAVSHAELVTLTAEDKQAILDAHNRLRALTAKGLIGGQPPAAYMPALEWDDRLMQSANNWVQQCIAGHDSKEARAMPKYSWVGQNWAGGYSTNYSSYVQMWFNEYSDYTYATKTCAEGKACGHYTQVVWAKSKLVGCGVAKCSNYPVTIVCNYAFGGNYNGESPYEQGDAASNCKNDYSLRKNGLCMRKDQCDAAGANCECTVTGCVNGGTLDSAACRCSCPAGFYGIKCENACEDAADVKPYCDYYGTGICVYPSYGPKCAKTCNLCTIVTRDSEVENSDGVKCRAPN